MKEHMQTVINICLAIFITVFIYQNNSQQDRIETLESNAQLNTDKAWDRLDNMDIDITAIEERLDKNLRFSLGISKTTYLNEENIKILFKNDSESMQKNFDTLFEAVKFNEERIIDNRRAVRDLAQIMLD